MTVWHNFHAILAQRRAAPGCFRLTGTKGCCGGSSHGFWEKFNYELFAAVKLKQREKNLVLVALPLRSIIYLLLKTESFDNTILAF